MAYSKRNLYTEQEAINSLDDNTISQQSTPILDQSPQGLEEAAWVKNIQERELQNEQEQLPKPINKTGIPDDLKAKLEHEFGFDLSKVRVHYNSDKPAEYGAFAYTQKWDIYISPGNEKYLEHELKHVIQQIKGEAKATTKINGEKVDDREKMEKDADNISKGSSESNFSLQELDTTNKMPSEPITQFAKWKKSKSLAAEQQTLKEEESTFEILLHTLHHKLSKEVIRNWIKILPKDQAIRIRKALGRKDDKSEASALMNLRINLTPGPPNFLRVDDYDSLLPDDQNDLESAMENLLKSSNFFDGNWNQEEDGALLQAQKIMEDAWAIYMTNGHQLEYIDVTGSAEGADVDKIIELLSPYKDESLQQQNEAWEALPVAHGTSIYRKANAPEQIQNITDRLYERVKNWSESLNKPITKIVWQKILQFEEE